MRLIRSSFLLLLTLVGCGDRAAVSGGGEAGGTIVIASPGGVITPMFPFFAEDPMGRLASDGMFDRLAEIGPDLNTVGDRGFTPRLATGWQWARDSLSITFALDPRGRWHDGQPVRASDVKFALSRMKDPKTGAVAMSLIGGIDSVSVRDSLTAVVWYKRRSPEQFYLFTYNVVPVPEHALGSLAPEAMRASAAVATPVGSGRFRVGRVEPGVRTELVADTTHYRGRPKLDRVIITSVPDPGATITQLFSGEADFIENVPPDAIGRADSTPTLRVVQYPNLQHVYLGFNMRDARRTGAPHPMLGDARVRRAISMALDRRAMLQNVYGARATLSTGPAPKTVGDTTVTLPPFDVSHAVALLDSAGWRAGANGMRSKNGQPLTFAIAVPSSSRPRARFAVLIQEQLRNVGINATIDQMDFRAFLDRTQRGNYDAAMIGKASDPSLSDLRQSWSSAGVPPVGQNFVRYSSRAVDAIADSLGMLNSPERVRQLRHRAFQTIADDAPGVWLYDLPTSAGAHRRLRLEGMRAEAWWAGLADWWIPANERIERDRIGLAPPPASQP